MLVVRVGLRSESTLYTKIAGLDHDPSDDALTTGVFITSIPDCHLQKFINSAGVSGYTWPVLCARIPSFRRENNIWHVAALRGTDEFLWAVAP